MNKFFKSTFCGFLIGVGAGIVLYIVAGMPDAWNLASLGKYAILPAVVGSIVGSLISITSSAENTEKVKQNAINLKSVINKKHEDAHNIQKKVDMYNISVEYISIELQKKGWIALKNVYNSNSELLSILEEINTQQN